jgi:LuxR family maltose regulon positive regulatory protein
VPEPRAKPARPWILPRERLVQRLLQVPAGGVGLIVAPPGYGGATLLRLVADASPLVPVAVELPPLPGDGRAFLERIGQALALQGIDLAPPGLADERGRSGMTNALRDAPDLLVLVDDLSTPGTPVDPQLLELLGRVPETVRVIIRTRRTPSFDVSRPLASGRLVLIQRDELALTQQEATEYLDEVAPALTVDGRAALIRLCEGWFGALTAGVTGAAGVQEEPGQWLLGPGLDLLIAPLVRGLDDADLDLLICTSVIERLEPEVCDAIGGRSDSARRLRELARSQVVHPLPPDQGSGYRLHGLVREHLRRQLAERGRAAERDATLKAGRWFAAQGHADEAISLLLECGEVDEALRVLDEQVEDLLDSGAAERVREWYRTTPMLAVAASDLHLLAAAWASMLTGDVPAVEGHLITLADRNLQLHGDRSDPRHRQGTTTGGAEWLRVETLLLTSFLEAWQGQPSRALAHVRAVRASYGDRWDRTAHQAAALHEARVAIWHGDHEAAARTLNEIRSRPGTNNYYRQADLPALGSMILAQEGRAHRARFLASQALEELPRIGSLIPVDDCDARLARARALVDLGEPEQALLDIDQVAQRASQVGHVTLTVLAGAAHALACAAGDDLAGAQEALARARHLVRERGAGADLGHALDRLDVEIAIAGGDRRGATRRLAALGTQNSQPTLAIRVASMGTAMSEAEVIQLVRAHQPKTPRHVVDARMLMASTLAPRRPAEAAMHLRTAADLAVEHGMLQALRGRSEELVVLAESLIADDHESSVRSLVAQLHRSPRQAPRSPSLSPGELDLLERIRTEAVNRELAAELGISVNTLKTRLRRMYAKLGVHDRATALEAIDRSRSPG